MNKLKRRRRRRRRGKWRNDWQISVIIVMMNTMFVRLSAAAVSVGQTNTKWAGLNPWEDFLHSSTCAWVENRDWTLELGLTAAICTTFSMEIPPLLFLKHFFFHCLFYGCTIASLSRTLRWSFPDSLKEMHLVDLTSTGCSFIGDH